ncbi:MAG: T9SS type A sorting domain-containing protein [Janthinobacterium lividum]
MKYLLLSAALLSSALAAQAQSANPTMWCAPGATWTYGYALFSAWGTLKVSYARDTVVAGQPAQLLTRSLTTTNMAIPGSPYYTSKLPSLVMRVVADRVEVQANGQFYTLYDFVAQPGSSWLTPRVVPQGPCPTEVVRVVVDSVGRQQVAGRSLRWFRAHLTSPTGGAVVGQWGGRMYEQVGNMGYMQPQSPLCAGTDPGYMGALNSFQAVGWPVVKYDYTMGSLVLLVLTTAEARGTAAGFRAYPNPSTGMLTLELPAQPTPGTSLQLLDLAGRVVRQLPVPAGRQLELLGLVPGAYTLLLTAPGQAPLAQRVLVE